MQGEARRRHVVFEVAGPVRCRHLIYASLTLWINLVVAAVNGASQSTIQ